MGASATGERGPAVATWPDEQPGFTLRTVVRVLAAGACYYVATRIAWAMCFPDSKVSLFFPPHAVLVSILLLVPTRHWWAYTLAAAGSHYLATQQVGWPPLYALHCEVFDAVQNVLTAAGIRLLIKSPFHLIGLREAVVFVLVAVVAVPFVTAFWGAAFTLSNGFGTRYWVEWRNLGISNAVTAIVLVPAILIGVHRFRAHRIEAAPLRVLEAGVLAVCLLAVGYAAFDRTPAGPDTSPALLYAPIPLLIWAALRFGLGGMSASMVALTMLAIWGTMQGRGPFLTQAPAENALALQLFLLMVATPLTLLAVAIDDERRSAQALRVSEERMNMAVESAQIALWDWDISNDRVWMTDEGRRIYGFEPGQPIDHTTLAGRVHRDDRAARAAAIRHTLGTGAPYEAEFRLVLPDGSVRWIAARGRSSVQGHSAGASPRILGVSMDVTRQKRAAAEAQQQREELAHLSRVASFSALSGSLAHELNQPLASILSNAQAGQRYITRDTPDLVEIRAILADIIDADHRAGDIILRLRSMLRREEVALRPVYVKECLDELLRLTQSDFIARGVSVSNLARSDLPPAMTDRVQLQQVLLNLIVNACDAMESKPREDRRLTLETSVAHEELRIDVLDSGVGLPDDTEALFEPFHTTKERGLGMGLSICRTLVNAHGGRLWAERRPEGGAAFHVALPLAKGDGQGQS